MSTKYDDSPLMNLTEKKVEVNFKKESLRFFMQIILMGLVFMR